MRRLLLLPLLLLAGCAGNVADYIGPRSTIISPQLIRYGFDVEQSRCVGQRLGETLTPLQLRRFQRVAAALRQGWADPNRLTLPDLQNVARSMPDPQVRTELDRAVEACGVTAAAATETAPAPAEAADAPGPPPAAWLNLGAAPSGQAIAVDANSLEQTGTTRIAWFRLRNPGEALSTGVSYLLRIDCQARTIAALEHQRLAEDGTVSERHQYPADENGPLPIEGGTVMEIAYLALCT